MIRYEKKIMPALTDEEIEQIITPTQSPEASTPMGVPENEQMLAGATGAEETIPTEGVESGLQIQ